MSFTVYLDESGITDHAICVVAGYAASSLRWSMFTRKWRDVLKKSGICEFHAQTFFARDRDGCMVREYKGWSQPKANAFLQRLIKILTDIKPVLVGTAVSVADFFAFTETQRRYLTGGTYDVRTRKMRGGAPRTPFHVPMQNTIIQAAKLAPKREQADFICDEQKQYCSYVIQRFNIIKKRNSAVPFGNIAHASSAKVSPLQAADLACYLAFRFAKERLKTGIMTPSRPFLDLIGDKNRFDYLDKSLLDQWTNGILGRVS